MACSGDMLLEALVARAGVTLAAAATRPGMGSWKDERYCVAYQTLRQCREMDIKSLRCLGSAIHQ
jgi:hypothetical protein